MAGKKTYKQIGSVLKAKDDPNQTYIKIREDVHLKEGQTVMVQTPAERIDRLKEKGYLSEEKAEERKQNVPHYVKFELVASFPAEE